jgi:hypothetical protein
MRPHRTTSHPAGRLSAGRVAILALVLGAAACDTPAPAPPSGGPATTTSTPAGPTTPPAPPADLPIPDRAFVTAPPSPVSIEGGEGGEYLSDFCGARYPSDGDIGRRRTRTVTYFPPDAVEGNVPDAQVYHTVTVYQPGRAAAAMAEVRAAVTACPTTKELDTGATVSYRLVPTSNRGDEILMVERTWRNPPDFPGPVIERTVVMRYGDVVSVVVLQGWEGLNLPLSLAESFADQAERTIRAWRG